jgi:hypothetical protein
MALKTMAAASTVFLKAEALGSGRTARCGRDAFTRASIAEGYERS